MMASRTVSAFGWGNHYGAPKAGSHQRQELLFRGQGEPALIAGITHQIMREYADRASVGLCRRSVLCLPG
jgi:hypothetical protein